MTELSREQAGALAGRLLEAERGRAASATLRPRSFLPFIRSGLTVADQLRLASMEQRLVVHGDAVAVLKAPGDRGEALPRSRAARRLSLLNRYRESIVALLPVGGLFLTALLLTGLYVVLPLPAYVPLLAVLAMLVWLTGTLLVGLGWSVFHALRALESKAGTGDDPSEGLLQGRYWFVTLVHAPDPGSVPALVGQARARANDLATRISRGRRPVTPPLLVALDGTTTQAAEDALLALPGTYLARERSPRLLRIGRESPQEHDQYRAHPRGIIPLTAVTTAIMLLAFGLFLSGEERDYCAAHVCEPGVGLLSLGTALGWLADHLLWGALDPGSVPALDRTRVMGVLFNLFGLVVVGMLAVAARLYYTTGKETIDRFEKSARAHVFADATPTLAVVTAIPVEMAAVRSLLPDGRILHAADDFAQYLLTRVPAGDTEREVVVTCIGEGGNSDAASVVANLARSFPSVNSVILCGIAAGVPRPAEPRRHVRLGDIVVAWQIVDFDHVDERPGGPVRRNGIPQPSSVLKRVDEALTTAEQMSERPWERWLDPAVTPRAADFPRPGGRGKDVLRDAGGRTLRHPPVTRTGHRNGWPKVHHGAIGSGDRSFRDAGRRDRLAERHDLIAFEMEAEGFGSGAERVDLSWMVVRGVSDYGGAEGSDPEWRRYAAFAAAAYVREILATAPERSPRGGRVNGV